MSNQIVNPFETTVPKLERITDKYRFISTGEFIKDVESLGFIEHANQRRMPRSGMGMHAMVFSRPDMPKMDGLDMQILATNSHDGSSSFRLFIQMFVQVCSNGLVRWVDELASRVVHRGYTVDKVHEALAAVQGRFNETLDTVKMLQGTSATPQLTAAFLNKAIELRDSKPYRTTDLVLARHREQEENTAWNVFNRVQESLIKGGYKKADTITNASGVEVIIPGNRVRELNAVKERVQVNTKLWLSAVDTFLNKA
jgi:hypothetical protein